MIRGVRLKKLLEQTLADKPKMGKDGKVKQPKTFRERFRAELGLTQTVHGMKLDRDNRNLEAKHVSLQEVAWEFLGREFTNTGALEEAFWEGRRSERLQEQALSEGAGGAVVLPSHFGNINAFVSTVAGLLDALIMEPYESPEFIGDKMVTMDYTRVNGGKLIGARGDGGEAEHKEPGEAAPMNGLKELYIEVPNILNFREAVAVNADTFIYDRTGQIQEAADIVGTKVGRGKELDIADVVQGLVNPFKQDGNTANTYQDAATALPNNYVNTDGNSLNDYTDINHAVFLLSQNRDPYTGYEIALRKPYTILVSPEKEATALTVTRATQVRTATQGATLQTYAPAPEVAMIDVMSSMIWYNRQVAEMGTARSEINWFMGNFPRAFSYRVISPFAVQDDPTEVSVRRDVLMCRVASLKGKAYVKNPRYVYRGTEG